MLLNVVTDSLFNIQALQCFVRLVVLWSHEPEKVSKQM